MTVAFSDFHLEDLFKEWQSHMVILFTNVMFHVHVKTYGLKLANTKNYLDITYFHCK